MAEQNENLNSRSLELRRRTVTTESFIAESKEIYGDRYDYSKVEYKNKEHRVTVVCPIHGDFQVYAREHLDGKGCPKCEKGEKYIAKLKEKFGDKFGLDKFVYESSTTPVTLICPTHGAFSRLPIVILNSKYGCQECGNDVLRQLQEQAHKDAIDHKEERDLARKERYHARREQERLKDEERKRVEEALAKEKWNEKIREILDNQESDSVPTFSLFDDYSSQYWHEDFFGLNLNALRNEDGTLLDGKQYIFLRPKHWPLHQMKVEANNGELVKATFYVCNLKKEQKYELLLILDDIFSDGYLGSIEDIQDKFEPYINQVFSYDGIKDGYKIGPIAHFAG